MLYEKAKNILEWASVILMFGVVVSCFGLAMHACNEDDRRQERNFAHCREVGPAVAERWISNHYPNRQFRVEVVDPSMSRRNKTMEVFIDGIAPFAVDCDCGAHSSHCTVQH